ncbi:SpoU rRNA methylases [Burkholderiales bacterium]
MEWIESEHNPRVQHWRRISESARARRESCEIWLEGARLVAEGLRSISKSSAVGTAEEMQAVLLVTEQDDAAERPEIHDLIRRAQALGVHQAMVSHRVWARLSQVEQSQGVALVMSRPEPAHSVEFVLSGARAWQDWVVLDGLQDPGNVGNLLRTAVAAGVAGAVLLKGTTEAFSPKALRAGMGAQFLLPVWEGVARSDWRAWADDRSVRTLLTLAPHVPQTQSLWESHTLSDPQGVAWVLGQEGAGLDPAWMDSGRYVGLSIPQAEGLESLNVTVAAGVCLFERARHRSLAERQA